MERNGLLGFHSRVLSRRNSAYHVEYKRLPLSLSIRLRVAHIAFSDTDFSGGAQAWVRKGGALQTSSGEGGVDFDHPNTSTMHVARKLC